jgi:hypothetical protein
MSQAKLIINGEREMTLETGAISFGRAPDNAVSLAGDSNVSRYHIEIERRSDDFYLIELGSSNGTTVNGDRIYEETRLFGGDQILLGGSALIDFTLEESPAETPASAPLNPAAASIAPSVAGSPAAPAAPTAPETPKASNLSVLLMIAGAVCGLAIVFVVAAVVFSVVGAPAKCEAQAKFISPESGETISGETEVEIDIGEAECVERAIFVLNGEEFATVDAPPFKATLDPSRFAGLSDGGTYGIRVILEDAEGNRIAQADEVLLAFETLATPTPTPEARETPAEKPTPKPAVGKQISPIEAQEMSRRLVGQFSGGASYKFDPQFLTEVQKKTGEYAAEGYFARASVYRDTINVAFVQEMSLDPALGYVLAMSRSGFKLQNQGNQEGLWRMTNDLVTANGYNGMCGGESLSDAKQTCAARAAALYLKALTINVFEGDVVYAVAAFGMSAQEASIWKSSLPADRADFWKLIKNPKQREEIVRFFAAGVVAENPQRFNLKNDRPLSELYRNLVNK